MVEAVDRGLGIVLIGRPGVVVTVRHGHDRSTVAGSIRRQCSAEPRPVIAGVQAVEEGVVELACTRAPPDTGRCR